MMNTRYKKKYMKIKHVLYILLMVFTVLPLVLFGGFMIYESNRRIDSIIIENLEVTSGMQILDIKKSCEDRKSRMKLLGEYAIVKDAVRESLAGSFNEEEHIYLNDLLKEQAMHSAFIASMSIVDRNFRVVSSSESYNREVPSKLGNLKEEYLDGNFHMLNVYERETDDGMKRVVDAIVD